MCVAKREGALGSESLWVRKWQTKSLLSVRRARVIRHHFLACAKLPIQSTASFYFLICDLVYTLKAQCSQQVLAVAG